jgi:hypothetical protein
MIFEQLNIGIHHEANQVFEFDFGFPIKPPFRLAGVSDQKVHF